MWGGADAGDGQVATGAAARALAEGEARALGERVATLEAAAATERLTAAQEQHRMALQLQVRW